MNDTERLQFGSREEFRKWLGENGLSAQSAWLVFGKKGGPTTLTAQEALEEALCFGWIDGQIRSIDDTAYLKYFARRRKGSVWSDRNKRLVDSLEERGLMTEHGRARVAEAKRAGTWDAPASARMTDEDAAALAEALRGREPAYSNYRAMSPSVRRTYAGLYLSAVSEESRARRLQRIVERLDQNLRPM